MRTLFESAIARERREWARAFLARQRREARLVLLAPGALPATRLLGQCLPQEAGCFGWERLTLDRLALRLAASTLSQRGLRPIDGVSQDALCTRALATLGPRGELGRFASVQNRPGLPRVLGATFRELSLARAAPERVAAQAPDLARLYDSYRQLLREHSLVDRGELLELAREAVGAGNHPLIGAPLLLLDVSLWHRAEQQFVSALLARTDSALVTVPVGDTRTRQALSPCVAETSSGGRPSLWDGALARLQAHLFERQAPAGVLEDEVVVMSAPGESRECVEVARRLLWAAGRGTPFDRMAVLLRSPARYRSHLEEALARAGVPAWFGPGSVRPDPAGRALLALLTCKEQGLSARAFAEYLSLDVVPRPAADGAPPPSGAEADRFQPAVNAANDEPVGALPEGLDALEGDHDAIAAGRLRAPHRWERLLVEAAVIGGLSRWRRRLAGLQGSLRTRLHVARRQELTEAPLLERELADLEHLCAFCLPLLQELEDLPERALWGQWRGALGALAVRALRRPERVLAALSELAPMAELGPVSLPEVRRVLQRPLRELALRPERDAAGKVFVAAIDDARGMDFDLVCVVGMAEKMFPERVDEDPILLDADRAAIDLALARNEQRIERERLQLRLAVGAANTQVILSYPRIDLERVRPRMPSFYGLEVLRAAEGTLPEYGALMRRADRVAAARIGWPAPVDAKNAIDEAEHDLSFLAPLLADAGDTRGSARYLLHVNPHLARALRFRARRWSVHRFTAADGLCELGEGARAALASRRLNAHAFAVTVLEQYASCPYRFALRALYGLSPRAEPAPIEQMDPLERGALMHEVQFETLSGLRDAGHLPLTRENLDAARQVLEASLRAAAERYRERLAPAIERVFDDAIESLHAELKRWLERAAGDVWQPRNFELSFGRTRLPQADPQSQSEPVVLPGGQLLAGSIDLVEAHGDRLRATDHKSGKPRAPRDLVVGGGHHLQPLLYALSLEALFPGREVVAGRLYYCTSDGGFEERPVPLNGETREAARGVLLAIDQALSEGFLPAAPAEGACAHCDYQPVCGPYEELRVARKDASRLRPLQILRRLP